MRLEENAQQTFPKFTDYVKSGMTTLVSNPPIVHGMRKWGKMSNSDIRRYLKWGTLPTIVVGHFTPSPTGQIDNFPDEIKLHIEMVEAFEGRDKLSRTEVVLGNGVTIPPQYPVFQNGRGKNVYIVGAEILHLLVRGHAMKYFPPKYGNGSGFTQERGFDQDVYGV